MKKQIIYHASCTDGFCSAWLCHLVWPDAEFIPANYGWDPPDVTGNDVLIVDFSYDREILLEMAAKAAKIEILDHHRTAQRKLQGLSFCTFDMTKSGARLTWDYLIEKKLFNPWEYWSGFSSMVHWLVEYVEDYDLHLQVQPDYEEVCAAIRNHDFTFEAYDKLALRSPHELCLEGRPVVRYQKWLIDHHVKYSQIVEINGVKGRGCQCSMNKLWSKVGESILEAFPDIPFAVIWQDTIDGYRLYSLRARKRGFDVGELAESMGGGGHKEASGFKVDYATTLNGPVVHSKPDINHDS